MCRLTHFKICYIHVFFKTGYYGSESMTIKLGIPQGETIYSYYYTKDEEVKLFTNI